MNDRAKTSKRTVIIIITIAVISALAVIASIMIFSAKAGNADPLPSSEVDNACRTLYQGVTDGRINSSAYPNCGIDLPDKGADEQTRESFAASATVKDALIFYGDYDRLKGRLPELAVRKDDRSIFLLSDFERNEDYVIDEGMTLSEGTTLGELYQTR